MLMEPADIDRKAALIRAVLALYETLGDESKRRLDETLDELLTPSTQLFEGCIGEQD